MTAEEGERGVCFGAKTCRITRMGLESHISDLVAIIRQSDTGRP